MTSPLVAVVGGTGTSGRFMLAALADAGIRTRAVVRDPDRAGIAEDAGADEAAIADLRDPASLVRAFDGASAIQMTIPGPGTPGPQMGRRRPREPAEILVGNATEAARDAGVTTFVLNSAMHPFSPGMPHHMEKARAEVELRRSGLAWTILQPATYAQNLLTRPREEDGEIVFDVPYSRAAHTTPVDLLDVAAVCALVHGQPEAHRFATYELCGPEVLDADALAEIVARVLGRSVEVREVPPAKAISPEVPLSTAAELTAMFAEYDRYGFVGNANILRLLLGRELGTVETVLRRGPMSVLAASETEAPPATS